MVVSKVVIQMVIQITHIFLYICFIPSLQDAPVRNAKWLFSFSYIVANHSKITPPIWF